MFCLDLPCVILAFEWGKWLVWDSTGVHESYAEWKNIHCEDSEREGLEELRLST